MGIKKTILCNWCVCKIFQQQSHIWTVIHDESFYNLSNIYMILFYVKANLQWGLKVIIRTVCIQSHCIFTKEKKFNCSQYRFVQVFMTDWEFENKYELTSWVIINAIWTKYRENSNHMDSLISGKTFAIHSFNHRGCYSWKWVGISI